ncbi:Uncharacterized protein HZ326_6044 [Fusarium oxysporum f. sp. albedinis]|nr:Uncharacterized protein HZ326_6044 [Fusarium oxysporum f. sp. albedinis]
MLIMTRHASHCGAVRYAGRYWFAVQGDTSTSLLMARAFEDRWRKPRIEITAKRLDDVKKLKYAFTRVYTRTSTDGLSGLRHKPSQPPEITRTEAGTP